MKKLFTLLVLSLFVSGSLVAQTTTEGFASVTPLEPVSIHTNLGDQPQSKVWFHDGKWWAVMPETDTGTHLWRLDGTSWNKVLMVSPGDYTKADVKVVGSLAHILLFRGQNLASRFVSLEYNSTENNYMLWSERPSRVSLELEPGVQTATIDMDKTGRMWLAYNGNNNVYVRWSDRPYETWSSPITLATGIANDDISGVIAIPALDKVGVMWSNQNTQRFGFRTHTDGADPTAWSADEVPASQSAANIGFGMANNHLNMAVASDGTLYAAVKTKYGSGQTQIALLVRRPDGTWDNMYEVATAGNRPIVILNEEIGKLKVIYAAPNAGGIFYKESPTSNIAFGNEIPLITQASDYATSSKDNYTRDIVIFASTDRQAFSVLATDNTTVTSIGDVKKGLSKNLSAYPNPFDSRVTVNFTLPESGEYSIALYDIKGSLVSHLGQGKAAAGDHKAVTLDGSTLPGGLYLVRLQSSGKTGTLKLVLQR